MLLKRGFIFNNVTLFNLKSTAKNHILLVLTYLSLHFVYIVRKGSLFLQTALASCACL
jgi:hypothetical protein